MPIRTAFRVRSNIPSGRRPVAVPFLAIACVFVASLPVQAQAPSSIASRETRHVPVAAPVFPETWVGTWRGTLTNYGGADSIRLTVPVTLTIARTAEAGTYRWRHVYANDTTRGMKDYVMRTVNAAAGTYVTDENNGILIDEQYTGGMLVSVFQVGEQMIENRTELRGDTLVQDLIAWQSMPVRTTSGAGPNGERGTPVMAFRVRTRQRSVFVRER